MQALGDIADPLIGDTRRHASLSGMAAAIIEASPRHFAMAGLSMGGYLAFEIFRQAPERVERIALLDTQARVDSPEGAEKRRRLICLAESGDFEAALTVLAWTDLVATTRASDDSLEAVVYGMAREVGPEAFIRQETAILGRLDSRPTLAQIECPALVLVGDDDRITPPHLSAEIAAGLAQARHVIVRDCGHLSTIERPDDVSAAMRAWLLA